MLQKRQRVHLIFVKWKFEISVSFHSPSFLSLSLEGIDPYLTPMLLLAYSSAFNIIVPPGSSANAIFWV